jgi:hypothetical protein
MRILKARLRPPELACIWGRKSTILQLSNSSDNHPLFQYLLLVSPRQEARPPQAGADNPRLSLLGEYLE